MMDWKLIVFDADWTLRRCTVPGQPCPNWVEDDEPEWELYPDVVPRLHMLSKDVVFGVASNQGGVALGYLTYIQARTLLSDMVRALKPFNVEMQYWSKRWKVEMCPHLLRAEGQYGFQCACRKPHPGMLCHLMMDWRIGPLDTLFVGDKGSDREAALRAGCAFQHADEFFGRQQ